MAEKVRRESGKSKKRVPKPARGKVDSSLGVSSVPVIDEVVGEEKMLFSWSAPIRPFKKREREYYTTIASIAFLIIVIMAFLREFLLIAVVVAFAFVSYVLAAIPPGKVKHQLTNRGIRSADKLYRWGDLRRYWIEEKFGQKMVIVQTAMLFPGQLLLLLGNGSEKQIRRLFNERLPYDEPEPTLMDKSASWLSEKVPLEKQAPSVDK
jgi:hypothetical protein